MSRWMSPSSWTSAVAAVDQFAAVGQPVRLVNLLPHEKLNSIPCGPIYEGLLNSGIPLSLVPYFADVGPVGQDCVKLAAAKSRL